MSRTSYAHRLNVLNELLVHAEFALHELSMYAPNEHVDDKAQQWRAKIEWLQVEIEVCELKLGLIHDPQS